MHSKGISLALLCTIYHIWKIRNSVLREEDRLAPIAAVRIIVRDVCRILFSLCPTHFTPSNSWQSQC